MSERRAAYAGRLIGRFIIAVSAGVILTAMTDAPGWAGTMTTLIVWFCSEPLRALP